MNPLIYILSALLFLLIVYQRVSHDQVITSQTFFIFMMQYENFLMLIFNRMAFAIDGLFTILLCTSFSRVLATIFDEMGSNTVKINDF